MCGTQSRSYVTIAASLSTDGSGDTTLIAAATTVSVFFVLALALLLKRRLNKPGRGRYDLCGRGSRWQAYRAVSYLGVRRA